MRPTVTPTVRTIRLFSENKDQLTITVSSCFGSRTPHLSTPARRRGRRGMHDHSIRSTSQRKAVSSALCLLDSKLQLMLWQMPCETPEHLSRVPRNREVLPHGREATTTASELRQSGSNAAWMSGLVEDRGGRAGRPAHA